MFFSEKYLLDTLKLANSIIFHLHAEAVSTNIELQHKYSNYIFEESNITTWKHYVNMTGEYHSLDLYLLPNLMEVKILETGNYEPLTKQTLSTYKNTYERLKLLGNEYHELIEKYPEFETLIKGIIFPVDMEVIKNAEDGDILSYCNNFIEKQEYSLISAIENEIKNYIKKWHVAEYTIVDEYYIPALISNITVNIIKKILNHRLSKIGTEEVYSVFMTEFFKSNLSIHNDVDILKGDVKLWLYKNLKYIIKNAGKDSTLDLIIKELLNKSGLYVKEILIRNRLPIKLNDASGPTYTKQTNNLFYVINGNFNYIVSNITNELMLFNELQYITYDTKDLVINDERYTNKIIKNISNPSQTFERSKIITIEYANLYNVFPANVAEITLENWIYNTFSTNIINYKNFTDPNTKITYNLSEKEAVLLTIKHLLILINRENVNIQNIILSNVPSELTNTSNLLIDNNEVITTANNLFNKILVYNGINQKEVINSIITFFNMLWVYGNDEYNPGIRSDISLLYERFKTPKVVELSQTPRTILEITENIVFSYGENIYDYKLSVVELIKTFTDINIDKHGEIDNLLSKFKNMIDKMTSYTTQTIPENLYSSASVANDSLGIIRDINVITPIKQSFLCLELIDHTILFEANDYIDEIYVNSMNIVNSEAIFVERPKLDVSVINDEIFELKVKTEAYVNDIETSSSGYGGFPYNMPANLGNI